MSLKGGSSPSLLTAWRTAIVTAILLSLLALFWYRETFNYLIGIWNQLESGNYAHGYLVLLISVYLIYDRRSQLKQLTPEASYSAVILIIPAGILWLAASIVAVEVVQSVALLMLIMAIVWASFGTQVARVLAFPVLYIIFALPVWFPLSPLLQNVTADAVFSLIRVIDIPALRENNMIILSSGRLAIEEACSGLRYLLASLTLGTLYAYLNYQTLHSRVLVVLVSAGAAILANIIRVFIIVYLAYETDMKHPLVADHLTFGWYIFSGVIFILLVIDLLIHKVSAKSEVTVTDDIKSEVRSRSGKSVTGSISFLVICSILVSAGPLVMMWSASQASFDKTTFSKILASNEASWVAIDIADEWNPLYPGADTFKATFRDSEANKVHLFLGVYTSQRQGYELINDLNRISDGRIWDTNYQPVRSYEFEGHKVLEQQLKKADGSKRLVWYWYRVAAQNTVDQYVAKMLQLKGMLIGTNRASVVAITTKLDSDIDISRNRMIRFVSERQSLIYDTLDGER